MATAAISAFYPTPWTPSSLTWDKHWDNTRGTVHALCSGRRGNSQSASEYSLLLKNFQLLIKILTPPKLGPEKNRVNHSFQNYFDT